MPNHITNIVRSKKLREIEKLMKSKDSRFDFNNILPLPKELKDTQSPPRIVKEEDYEKEVAKFLKKENVTDLFRSLPITEKMQKEYKEKFGADNWYDWQVSNWGTKWNAYEVFKDKKCIEFQTAWSTPLPIIVKISSLIPDTDISVEFADEDIGGGNCGSYTARNGKIIAEEQGTTEFACKVWGMDYKEYLEDIKE